MSIFLNEIVILYTVLKFAFLTLRNMFQTYFNKVSWDLWLVGERIYQHVDETMFLPNLNEFRIQAQSNEMTLSR